MQEIHHRGLACVREHQRSTLREDAMCVRVCLDEFGIEASAESDHSLARRIDELVKWFKSNGIPAPAKVPI